MEKRQSCAYCQYSNLPAYLYKLINQSFLFTIYSIQEKVEKVDSDKIVQSQSTLFMSNMGAMEDHQLLSE